MATPGSVTPSGSQDEPMAGATKSQSRLKVIIASKRDSATVNTFVIVIVTKDPDSNNIAGTVMIDDGRGEIRTVPTSTDPLTVGSFVDTVQVKVGEEKVQYVVTYLSTGDSVTLWLDAPPKPTASTPHVHIPGPKPGTWRANVNIHKSKKH